MNILAKLSFWIIKPIELSIMDALDQFKRLGYVEKLKTQITSENLPLGNKELINFLYDQTKNIWWLVMDFLQVYKLIIHDNLRTCTWTHQLTNQSCQLPLNFLPFCTITSNLSSSWIWFHNMNPFMIYPDCFHLQMFLVGRLCLQQYVHYYEDACSMKQH